MALLMQTPAVQTTTGEWKSENLPHTENGPSLWSANESAGGNDRQWRKLVDALSLEQMFIGGENDSAGGS
ncbi:MAG: hypothetical protein RQ801_15825, partial [Spirochaetaceae bacterium]|nr:hypothetical protein [Spirochaetaceae bacterium]